MSTTDTALGVSAEVNYGLEFFDDARSAIEEAVDILSRYGYPSARAKAMESYAKICR